MDTASAIILLLLFLSLLLTIAALYFARYWTQHPHVIRLLIILPIPVLYYLIEARPDFAPLGAAVLTLYIFIAYVPLIAGTALAVRYTRRWWLPLYNRLAPSWLTPLLARITNTLTALDGRIAKLLAPFLIKNHSRDYRPKDHFSRKSSSYFYGSSILLLVLVLWTAWCFFLAYEVYKANPDSFGPLPIAIISAIATYAYYHYKNAGASSLKFLSATETPPPDLSPPTKGVLRATIQKRIAKYRDGFSTRRQHELLCWLVLSEAAYETAKSGGFLNHTLFTVPPPEDVARDLQRLGVKPTEPQAYTLAQALSDKPLYHMARDAIQLAIAENNLRDGLQELNKLLTGLPAQKQSDTFEL